MLIISVIPSNAPNLKSTIAISMAVNITALRSHAMNALIQPMSKASLYMNNIAVKDTKPLLVTNMLTKKTKAVLNIFTRKVFRRLVSPPKICTAMLSGMDATIPNILKMIPAISRSM